MPLTFAFFGVVVASGCCSSEFVVSCRALFSHLFFFLMIRHPPISPLFPSPPLFRSPDRVRLPTPDDVGIGKPTGAALIARELLDGGDIGRLAVLCPPHLVEQWGTELESRFHLRPV